MSEHDEQKLAILRAGAAFAFKLALDSKADLSEVGAHLDDLLEAAPDGMARDVAQEIKNAFTSALSGDLDISDITDV